LLKTHFGRGLGEVGNSREDKPALGGGTLSQYEDVAFNHFCKRVTAKKREGTAMKQGEELNASGTASTEKKKSIREGKCPAVRRYGEVGTETKR